MELPDGCSRVECPEPVEGLCFVYILVGRNGSFYVGQTHDLNQRLARHRECTGARHTAQLDEFELVYFEGPMEIDSVIKRERQLKKWSRAKKLALICGDKEGLRCLSRSRD